jgi:protein required for attachment to host cells
MRHAEEPRSDPHRQAKSTFARTIADYLERADHEKKFDQIVLVAPPVTLGDLRAMLGKQVAKRVAGEIGKDLTESPIAEIITQLHAAIRL